MNQPFDFNELHRDPKAFLNCVHGRQVADIYEQGDLMFSPKNMTDLEVLESIVADVLAVTMWEIQTGSKLDFDRVELLRFVSCDQHERILKLLNNNGLVRFMGEATSRDQLRILDSSIALQEAMDFCGIWYTGYKMPNDTIVLADPEAIGELLNDPLKLGGLMMELSSNAPSTNTLQ